ncbi:MAG: hypothetical protein HDS88_06565 [Bacteroidales bacterium]|nr:hypothetical protein [Bacteroidales bacterium]
MANLRDSEPTNNNGLSTLMIILGALLCQVIIVLVVIMGIPKWILSTVLAICAFLIYYGFKIQVKSRETRIYIDEDGNLDLTSSREYEAKEVSGLQAFWGSPWMFTPGMQIMKFALADGVVYVETKNGKFIKAPLSDLEVIIQDKSRGMDCAVLLLKYGDDKIKVTHNSIRFEEEEIEDINAILTRAGKVRESKVSKLSGLLAQINSIAKDVTDEDAYINLSGDIISSLNEKYRERAAARRSQSDSEPQEESFAKYLEDQLNNIDEKQNPRTQLQIDTDNRIDELITDISNNNLPDENEVKRLLSDSSDKGRHILLCAYESGLENRGRNMVHSFISDAVYPLECTWHWIKEKCEDIETLWMLKSFLIGVFICIPLFMFDSLGWWNILLGIGIGCLWLVVCNKYLAKAETSDNGIQDEIADLRNGILNNPDKENQEASAAAVELISDHLKSRYKRGKIACWIWSEVIVGILIGCLLAKYGEAESGDTIPLAEQNEVSTMTNSADHIEMSTEFSEDGKVIIFSDQRYKWYYIPDNGKLPNAIFVYDVKNYTTDKIRLNMHPDRPRVSDDENIEISGMVENNGRISVIIKDKDLDNDAVDNTSVWTLNCVSREWHPVAEYISRAEFIDNGKSVKINQTEFRIADWEHPDRKNRINTFITVPLDFASSEYSLSDVEMIEIVYKLLALPRDDKNVKEYFTSNGLQRLREDYDYDCPEGDCYALWSLTNGAQDDAYENCPPNRVIGINPDKKGGYTVIYFESGYFGATHIKVNDGKIDDYYSVLSPRIE